ncbi:hypothetical protein D2E25_1733 [Bifidobacterium goeldii]|uniref:Galactofuranosyltransferase n=1 Tax=Bifidobacterium goeldii TaxID=2306975 RepID=A0A430FGA3_9BIFI|nr:hypothetical protein [Bifidobacterium goeldii]RSX51758.1 hypothetical protein D2E25_1733 [Bifidobacterium goeldii]
MVYYEVSEESVHKNHAGLKARSDITKILKTWNHLALPKGEDKGLFDKIICIPKTFFGWFNIYRRIKKGDVILLQYPMLMYPKVSLVALPLIKAIKGKGAKLIYLIHDLQSLRGYDFKGVDQNWLMMADAIISHNSVMSSYLKESGVDCPIVDLEIFDYLIEDIPSKSINKEQGIVIAGNMDPEKAGYVYQLFSHFPNADFKIYGPNFVPSSNEAKWYEGSVPPDLLPHTIKGKYGLVWDGPSIEKCEGTYGEYLRVNNPHKLSLYIISGLPILIWKEAAEADFVVKNGIGFAVNSIDDAISKIRSVDENEYRSMQNNVKTIQERLAVGYYTNKSLEHALALI